MRANIKQRLLLGGTLLLAGGLSGGLVGCASHERVIVRETVVGQPVVRRMPAVIHEDRGPAPGYGWNWVQGHWKWEGNDWAWVHGHWVEHEVPVMPPVIVEQITVAPSPRHFWVPGHWVWRAEGRHEWFWVRGGWHI
ncbi:hypothetical protein [Chitinimonas sp.]|uniref:hypothetical protein n=1 Tax=Chitinimonas sp. TaxID=1934313 RepID=UPI002F93E75C